MSEEKVRKPVPRMSYEEIKEFVLGVCDNRIWTDRHCRGDLAVRQSFMILGLATFEETDLDSIGTIWEYMSQANPMAVNGMPTFFSCRLMHIEDARMAWKAIDKEMERRRVQLPPQVSHYLL